MGVTLIGLLLANFIAFLISCGENVWEKQKLVLGWLCPIFSTIVICAVGIANWGSYSRYVDLRATYDATIEQYATSIEIYGGKAVLDVKSAAWTDLKYEGYQKNIAGFIVDLRKVVSRYNKRLIKQLKYAENWFFSWVVIAPDDDMKIISMKAAQNHKVKG